MPNRDLQEAEAAYLQKHPLTPEERDRISELEARHPDLEYSRASFNNKGIGSRRRGSDEAFVESNQVHNAPSGALGNYRSSL